MELAILEKDVEVTNLKQQSIVDNFYRDCKIQGLSKSTCYHYLYNLRRFQDWAIANKIDIINVDKAQLRDYIEYMRFTKNAQYKTLKNHLSALSSFYNYLCFDDIIKINPVLPVRKRYIHQYK